MATDTKASKMSVKKSATGGQPQPATKSTMQAGLGLFKDKIVTRRSSAWADDLRVTIKK